MKTKAVRLYGANDIRLEEFELPEITEEEILIKVVSDSVCASTWKAVKQGTAHKRVPPDVADKPIIIGHEMCGEILQVGETLKDTWKVGQKIVIQPALKLDSGYDPGYSYPYIGGNTQYAIVPKIVLERNCMLPYEGDGYFKGSLVESLACVLRGYKGLYHTDYTNYVRTDGAKKGGKIVILGGAGPMGIGTVELACGYAEVSQVVVTDLSDERLAFAEENISRITFIFLPKKGGARYFFRFLPDMAKQQAVFLVFRSFRECGFSGISQMQAHIYRIHISFYFSFAKTWQSMKIIKIYL